MKSTLGGDYEWNRICGQRDERNFAVGLAVIEGWKFVHDSPSHAQTFALMSASQAYYSQRAGGRFLEHRVVASASFDTDVNHFASSRNILPGQPTYFVGQQLLQEARNADAMLRITSGIGRRDALYTVNEVMSAWASSYGVSQVQVVAWPAWAPLAFAIARGLWYGDVTAVPRRDTEGYSSPVQPSSRQLKAFRTMDIPFQLSPPASVQAAKQGPSPFAVYQDSSGSCPIRRFSTEHLVNSLRLSSSFANQKAGHDAALAALRFWYPEDWRVRGQRKSDVGHVMPGAVTLRRARVRFDIACMLHRREWYAKHLGQTYRYLSFDASPQRPGIEVFATVERVVNRSLVREMPHSQFLADVEVRRFPLAMLGHSRASLPDKLQSHVHQVWLEYGPAAEQLRTANLDVRQCLSDMGTEWGIADCADVVLQCTGQGQSSSEQAAFLYPMAIAVPGPQHIIDGILKDVLQNLDWWPSWQKQAKVVCQWLHNRGHREFLQSRLRAAGLDKYCLSLDASIDRFAQWRWKTLANVTAGLAHVEDAMRAVAQVFSSAKDLASRDIATGKIFLDTSKDSQFWDRASGLKSVSNIMKLLSAWVRGCECHEAERLAGHVVSCKWAGCRARSFAARLRSTRQDIYDLRAQAANGHLRGFDCTEQISMLTRMLAVFDLKFSWVFEPPYLIWEARRVCFQKSSFMLHFPCKVFIPCFKSEHEQMCMQRVEGKTSHRKADDPAKAREFLRKHDNMVSLGISPHRVSDHFAGVGDSSLRSDMEAWAAGHSMSARLREAVSSYQLCILDDTWVESVHREVSHVSKRSTYSKLQWRSSTLRLQQNLKMVETLDDASARRFNVLFRKFKAIAQPVSSKAIRMVFPRAVSLPEVLGKVYRFSAHALKDWSAELQSALKPLEALEPQHRARRNARLKIDYLKHVISDNHIYSVPIVERAASLLGRRTLEDARLAIDEVTVGHRFFEVLDVNVRRKKLVRTAAIHERRLMSVPALVQPCVAWRGEERRRSAQQDVFPDGFAEVIDLLALEEWRFLRAGLRRWKRGASDIQGCISVHGAISVSETPWDFRRGPVPAIAVLEKLVALKWKVGQPLPKHTLASPLVFSYADPMNRKAYLQCLVCLPELLAGDAFLELVVGHPNSYYACVLQAARPELVEVGHPEAYYERCVAEGHTFSLSIPRGQPSNQDGEDLPMLSMRSSSGVALAIPPQKRPRLKRSSADDMALWEMLPEAVPKDSEGQPAAAMDAESQDERQAPKAELPDDYMHPDARGSGDQPRPAASARERKMRPMSVEGVQVTQEQHGQPGEVGAYQRLIVHCPCSGNIHAGRAPCVKKRNVGLRQTANFGQLEPYAFLGVWLRERENFASRDLHLAYVPNKASVASYMREHGWLE